MTAGRIPATLLALLLAAAESVAAEEPSVVRFDRAPSVAELERALGFVPRSRAIYSAGTDTRLDRPAEPEPAAAAAPSRPVPARPAASRPEKVSPMPARADIKPGPVPEVWVQDRIDFVNGSDEVLSSALGIVDAVGAIMRARPGAVLVVSGHANATGPDVLNDALSRRRAAAVRRYLLRFYGLDPARVELRWMGAREPIRGTDPAAGENRRVQFGVLPAG